MKKLDLDSVPKLENNPTFKGMKQSLKNPKKFEEIEEVRRKTLYSDHKHSSVSSYVKCKRCNEKREKWNAFMKTYGFASVEQYLLWKKVHTIIKDKKNFELN